MIQSLQFIGKYILKETKLLMLGVLMTLAISVLTWSGPKVIAYLIDQGLIPKNHAVAVQGVILLALVELCRLLAIFLSQVVYATLGQNVIERVRSNMVEYLLKLPVSYFDRVSSGSMMTRVVNDVNSLTDFFQSGFVSVLGNLATIIAIFVGLWALSFKLGTLLFLAFVPVAIACGIFSGRLRIVYDYTRNQLSNLNAMLADFLFGMRTIRSLGISFTKYRELNSQIRVYAGGQMKMVRTFALFHPALSLGIGILTLILIAMGLPMIHDQTLKVGEWVAALSYIVALQQPLVEISDRWNFFLAGLTSIERIRGVFNEKVEKYGTEKPEKFSEIQFHEVSFQYQSDSVSGNSQAWALKNVNLTIRRGEWLGVYGLSGSGKSTLLQMIYGFYLPTLGVVTWNGNPYPDLDLAAIRSHFGVVEQFPFLFSGTVRDNLTLFGEHSLDVVAIRKQFIAFPLIQSILNQLDLQITERGGNLSMGQKQMIAFLRAYLAGPDLWILDEATAFFDEEAEKEVFQALAELRGQITVIQVAHRPEALVSMDRLIFVNQGQVLPVQSSSRDSK